MKSHLKHDSFLEIRDIMHFKTMKSWIRKKKCLIRVGVFNSVKRVKKCCYDSSK